MDKFFVDLYKRINMDASNEQIDMRMRGIDAALEQIDENEIADLVKIFVGKHVEKDCLENFFNYFYNEDYSFEIDNREELSILAGYILHKLLEDEDYKAKAAGLITLMSLVNIGNRYGELYQEALNTLRDMMSEIREEQKELKSPNLKTIDVKALKSSIESEEGINVQNQDQLLTILNVLDNNIRVVKEQNRSLISEVKKYREESQILSWVIGEYCDSKKTPLKLLEEKETALLLGNELAQFISIYPGPYAADSFLFKMLSKTKDYSDKEYSLAQIVNILSLEDKDLILSSFEDEDLSIFPIMLAISESQKVDGDEEWYPLYKKKMGVLPEEIRKNCTEWAYQIYLEKIVKMAM